jgi:tRNA threonylcarbamoyladenosine dehydratase
MEEWLSRTELLIGADNIKKLKASHVLVAGLGGVGGYAAEQLCRAGIGELTLIDGDVVTATNKNRQLIALTGTMGKPKALIMGDRLRDINPNLKIHLITDYIKEERWTSILEQPYDYIVDAIDTLTPKVALLAEAVKKGFPVVSSMGSGGKLDPEGITISDIAESHHCRFAYIVRKYLHRIGIFKGIIVVYSPETVNKDAVREVAGEENKRSVVGTISYMPPLFGCYCASVVIRNILQK